MRWSAVELPEPAQERYRGRSYAFTTSTEEPANSSEATSACRTLRALRKMCWSLRSRGPPHIADRPRSTQVRLSSLADSLLRKCRGLGGCLGSVHLFIVIVIDAISLQ